MRRTPSAMPADNTPGTTRPTTRKRRRDPQHAGAERQRDGCTSGRRGHTAARAARTTTRVFFENSTWRIARRHLIRLRPRHPLRHKQWMSLWTESDTASTRELWESFNGKCVFGQRSPSRSRNWMDKQVDAIPGSAPELRWPPPLDSDALPNDVGGPQAATRARGEDLTMPSLSRCVLTVHARLPGWSCPQDRPARLQRARRLQAPPSVNCVRMSATVLLNKLIVMAAKAWRKLAYYSLSAGVPPLVVTPCCVAQ